MGRARPQLRNHPTPVKKIGRLSELEAATYTPFNSASRVESLHAVHTALCVPNTQPIRSTSWSKNCKKAIPQKHPTRI
jgi:uncharacterized protein (DUF58 family)